MAVRRPASINFALGASLGDEHSPSGQLEQLRKFQAIHEWKDNGVDSPRFCLRTIEIGKSQAVESETFANEVAKFHRAQDHFNAQNALNFFSSPPNPAATSLNLPQHPLAALVTVIKQTEMARQVLNLDLEEYSREPQTINTEWDMDEIQTLKRNLDKAKSDLDSTVQKTHDIFKRKSKMIDESYIIGVEQRMEQMSEEVEKCRRELDAKLNEIQLKQTYTVLRNVYNIAMAQHNYHEKVWSCYRLLKPKLDDIQKYMENNPLPAKEGYLQVKSGSAWKRYWFILRNGELFYFKGKGKEIAKEEKLQMELCTVRSVRKPPSSDSKEKEKDTEFEIITPHKKNALVLQADTEQERFQWMEAITQAISNALNSQTLPGQKNAPKSGNRMSSNVFDKKPDENVVELLQKGVAGNSVCADCDCKDPDWSSINIGILLCLECSGVHRHLGVHISKVRSLTLDRWDKETLLFMQNVGNQTANEILEHTPSLVIPKPKANSKREDRELYIKLKYNTKGMVNKSPLSQADLNMKLFDLCAKKFASIPSKEDIKVLVELILQGADVNFQHPQLSLTPLMAAVQVDNVLFAEILIENGANVFIQENSQGWTSLHFSAQGNHFKCGILLLKRGFGSRRDLKDKNDLQALDIAQENGSQEMVQLLKGENLTLDLESTAIAPTHPSTRAGYFFDTTIINNRNSGTMEPQTGETPGSPTPTSPTKESPPPPTIQTVVPETNTNNANRNSGTMEPQTNNTVPVVASVTSPPPSPVVETRTRSNSFKPVAGQLQAQIELSTLVKTLHQQAVTGARPTREQLVQLEYFMVGGNAAYRAKLEELYEKLKKQIEEAEKTPIAAVVPEVSTAPKSEDAQIRELLLSAQREVDGLSLTINRHLNTLETELVSNTQPVKVIELTQSLREIKSDLDQFFDANGLEAPAEPPPALGNMDKNNNVDKLRMVKALVLTIISKIRAQVVVMRSKIKEDDSGKLGLSIFEKLNTTNNSLSIAASK
eukprot:TRINITY_DN2383_c0_g1_i4.p1 TRINITY_DN2383_c0_g1~~TRINITY_DN2383_c0_g1_i4.p1  ORF type:complete len:997 (-),score=256.87 TRINITY_DN2383_c0_g1_i4:127-3117(-)